MKTIKAIAQAIALATLTLASACGPLNPLPPCEDNDCVAFRRAAALAMIQSGALNFSTPPVQPYILPQPINPNIPQVYVHVLP